MYLLDVLKKINKSKEFEDEVYISDFAENVLNIYDIQNWDKQSRLISYYILNWYCTDSIVGFKVYFFDDVPVAISSQRGRKCNEDFQWISKELYQKVYDYIISFREDEDHQSRIVLIDEKQYFPETFNVDYYYQMMKYHKENALYNDQKVNVVGFKDSYIDGGKYHQEQVEIKFENDTTKWIQTKELRFPINIKTT